MPVLSRLSAVFVVSLGMFACGTDEKKGGPPSVPVVTELARGGDVATRLVLRGELTSPMAASVAAESAGTVVRVPARVGEAVAPGAVLVELDSEPARIQERLALARVEQAEATVELRKAAADRARTALERLGQVHGERPDAVSAREMEEATLNQAETSAALRAARADVMARRAELDAARLERRRMTLLAPGAGVVVRQLARVGQRVAPGTSLVELTGAGAMEAVFEAGESQIGLLSVGAPVRLSVPARPDLGVLETVLTGVAPAADGASRVQWVRADVAAPPPGWVPGFAIEAEVSFSTGADRVVVSRDALIRGAVYVITEGKAREVKVEVRGESGEDVILTGDLVPGAAVVIRGNEALADGMPVSASL